MEIERKWLVKGFPIKLEPKDFLCSTQTYLNFEPEVRIRTQKNLATQKTEYFLTIKGNGKMLRTEVNKTLSQYEFSSLSNLTPYKEIIEKHTITYQLPNNLLLEINCIKADSPWLYAEIEFPDVETAKKFTFPLPELIIKEITDDDSYKMKNYYQSLIK